MTTSSELVPSPRRIALEKQHADERRAVLEQLGAEAKTADEARARQIMIQGRAIAQALKEAKAPFEEARLAGKASVLAARRLGRLLARLDGQTRGKMTANNVSARRRVAAELGLTPHQQWLILRLGELSDADFQRYIQREDVIPSVNGAFRACGRPIDKNLHLRNQKGSWKNERRKRVGVKTPRDPSIDEAYSLIVRALGHLGGSAGGGSRGKAVASAMDYLYAAEDQLKPYCAGYDGTGRKAA